MACRPSTTTSVAIASNTSSKYIITLEIFYACHLVQPSNRGEYEISEAIDLLIRSARTIDTIELEGWRIDIGYPEDRDEVEERPQSAAEA